MTDRLILASRSPFRRALLANAGIAVEVVASSIDERAVEASLAGTGVLPDDLAFILAEAKAADVSARSDDAVVIGCDQTLSLNGHVFHKPADIDAARRQLLALSGRTHHLNSGLAIVQRGQTLWRHVEIARMTMRDLSPHQIGRYLARIGDRALDSVGAYQIEGEGIALFDAVEGDYFAIVGLPLLPLLSQLRKLGAIDD